MEKQSFSMKFIVSPGKKTVFLAVVLGLLSFPAIDLNSESYNFQTFYPLHYGRYRAVTVTERIDIGRMTGPLNNIELMSLGYLTIHRGGAQPPIPTAINAGTVPTPLGVIANADLYLISKGGVVFTPGSGKYIMFPNNYTYFDRFCKWYSGPSCPVIGGKAVSGGGVQSVQLMTVAISSNPAAPIDFIDTSTGTVLCCRFDTQSY